MWPSPASYPRDHHEPVATAQPLSVLFCLAVVSTRAAAQEANYVAGALVRLNDNGAWSWFMDERAIVSDGKLVVGSVRSVGPFGNTRNPDWGSIEVAAYDLAAGSAKRAVLHRHFEQDDHDSPALLALPDHRLLAMYSKHGQVRKICYRVSEPGYDNGIYHGFLRDEVLHFSDGKVAAPLSKSGDTKAAAWDFTPVAAGDADNVCWVDDVRLDQEGKPCVVFSVKKDGRGTGGKGGLDIRFHSARWDGTAWRAHEMAYAGSRLYADEADYTGLAVLDRRHPGVVYLSTDADPVSGRPLISAADSHRHHELFRGTTADGGRTWRWEALTANSTVDNLRPVVPAWGDGRTALV
jgi:hypothetical protein